MSDVLQLARDLIARPSVTPDDAGCQRLIAARLVPLGFEAQWLHCGEVSNLLLTHGRGDPTTWFLGHTDVVPPGPLDAWSTPPFEPAVRGGRLYGRGACDMKGAVAAMVVALERFTAREPEHSGQLGLLLTSDEEGAALDGVRQVAGMLGRRRAAPDFCLVGEPSSRQRLGDTVRIGRRGSNTAVLTVHGVQGHTAFPEAIDNPVHRLAPFLAELVGRHWDDGLEGPDGRFPPSHCQVSNFNAGIGAMNVTPPEAVLTLSFRNNPHWDGGSLRAAIEAMLQRHGIEDYRLDWQVSGEPFLSRAGALRGAVVAAVGDCLDVEPELNTGGGTSDGRFIAPLGTEVVELGLLNESIHKIDENTPVDDLDKLAAVYESMLDRLHGD